MHTTLLQEFIAHGLYHAVCFRLYTPQLVIPDSGFGSLIGYTTGCRRHDMCFAEGQRSDCPLPTCPPLGWCCGH